MQVCLLCSSILSNINRKKTLICVITSGLSCSTSLATHPSKSDIQDHHNGIHDQTNISFRLEKYEGKIDDFLTFVFQPFLVKLAT